MAWAKLIIPDYFQGHGKLGPVLELISVFSGQEVLTPWGTSSDSPQQPAGLFSPVPLVDSSLSPLHGHCPLGQCHWVVGRLGCGCCRLSEPQEPLFLVRLLPEPPCPGVGLACEPLAPGLLLPTNGAQRLGASTAQNLLSPSHNGGRAPASCRPPWLISSGPQGAMPERCSLVGLCV